MARQKAGKWKLFGLGTLLITIWGTASVSSAALIKLVQSQSVSLSANSLGATVAIPVPVAPNSSFSVFNAAVSETAPLSGEISGIMNSAGTSMIFKRMGAGNPVTLNFSVASFQSGVTVQNGEVTLGTASPTTVINLSTAVNTAESFVILSHRNIDFNYGGSNFVRAQLSSTQLTLDTSITGTTQNIVDWQVVDYAGCSVQAGNFAVASAATTLDVPLAPNVTDFNHSALYFTYTSDSPANQTDVSPNMLIGTQESLTNLNFSRFSPGSNLNVSYFYVKFNDGTYTNNFQFTSGAGGGAGLPVYPPIDAGRTILTAGGMYHRGCSTSSTSDIGAGDLLMSILDPADVELFIAPGPSTGATISMFSQEFAGLPLQVSFGTNNGIVSTVAPGSAAPLMQFKLTNQSLEDIHNMGIILIGEGTGNSQTDVSAVQIIRDTDGNGLVGSGDVTLGSGVYNQASNAAVTIAFNQNGGETLPAGQTHNYLVQYVFAPSATVGLNYSCWIYDTSTLLGQGVSSGVSVTGLGNFILMSNSVSVAVPTATPTITATATATNTATLTPTITGTFTITPTQTPTVTLTSTMTSTITLTPTQTPTVTLTPTKTPTVTLTPTTTSTVTLTPTITSTVTLTPTVTLTVTLTPTITLTYTPTSTITLTPTQTPTVTLTPTKTPTVTLTPTASPTTSPTGTATLTSTVTITPTMTLTPSPTATITLTMTLTPTATLTPTKTSSPTRTPTITQTPTATLTITLTASASPTKTMTASATATATATKTITLTATRTFTATLTVTASATATATITFSPTVTNTPPPTNTPTITNTAGPTDTPTITPTPSVALTLDSNFFTPPTPLGINARVDKTGQVKIEIFNLLGEKVKTVLDQNLPIGITKVYWSGANDGGNIVGNALYFVIIKTPDSQMVCKVVLIR